MEHVRTQQKASTKPLVTYNPELDKYEDTVMCPDKVARGREMLAKAGLPLNSKTGISRSNSFSITPFHDIRTHFRF